jgi:hypothetical protein
MRRQVGVDGDRHPGTMISIVNARILQLGADDSERLDAERPKPITDQAEFRNRAPAEGTIDPAEQTQEQRASPSIIRESN